MDSCIVLPPYPLLLPRFTPKLPPPPLLHRITPITPQNDVRVLRGIAPTTP